MSADQIAQAGKVRVASVQFGHHRIGGFDEFVAKTDYFVSVAASYEADFVVLPEMFTLMLLSAAPEKLAPAAAVDALSGYTEQLNARLRDMAVRYKINIIAGSHIARNAEGAVRNTAYVFLRDGAVRAQEKIHATPSERDCWGVGGGDEAVVIETDRGPVGVLICYDSEFPELARKLIDDGAQILFVPFCTDTREGYLRVRYCCQARAIENQCYLVLSGNVGNLPNVENMDVQYAQSCVITPCDFPFARDGVAAEASANVETVIFADLDLGALEWARRAGTVRNLADRRSELYRGWKT